jgi:DNA polymerase-3 subunit epsilon
MRSWDPSAQWEPLDHAPSCDWIALDFETATSSRASACALGLVYVKDGAVVGVERVLIRPPGNEYSGFNIGIHGIHPVMTMSSPSFGKLWPVLHERVGGKLLVAHNASFDVSVLRHCLDECGCRYPDTDYLCTLVVSRARWPHLHSHRLPDIAHHCGITLKHHDPGEDARACAEILLHVAWEGGGATPHEVARRQGIHLGRLHAARYRACGRG